MLNPYRFQTVVASGIFKLCTEGKLFYCVLPHPNRSTQWFWWVKLKIPVLVTYFCICANTKLCSLFHLASHDEAVATFWRFSARLSLLCNVTSNIATQAVLQAFNPLLHSLFFKLQQICKSIVNMISTEMCDHHARTPLMDSRALGCRPANARAAHEAWNNRVRTIRSSINLRPFVI